jgi:ribosomal protein L37AE/L43A
MDQPRDGRGERHEAAGYRVEQAAGFGTVRTGAPQRMATEACDRCGSVRLIRVKACWRCEACGYKSDCNGW